MPSKLWSEWNDVLHEQKEDNQHEFKSERVDGYIQGALCNGKEEILVTKQATFKRGLKATLLLPLATEEEAWVSSIRVVMER